ncbi:MAG TPA: hypothetical protein VMU51_30775 [Mycobacteriales bacterium]|nr:hypothetical protein [Mycobacteriales bacterium]
MVVGMVDSGPARPAVSRPGHDLDVGGTGPGAAGWLAVTATAYVLLHHVGTALGWLGSVGLTRWADWVDLGTPYAVVLSAGIGLARSGRAGAWVWGVYAVGAVTYVEGHGIHLAANSIGNVAPGPAAHFWDETAGHYLWQAGWILVLAALTAVFAGRPAPRGPWPYCLAAALGVTAATNTLEGGTAALGLLSALAFVAAGWMTRRGTGRLLLLAYGLSLLILVGYGLWQQGFPQPSQL